MELHGEALGRLLGAALFTFAATRLVMGFVWALRPSTRRDIAGVVAFVIVTAAVFVVPHGGPGDARAIRESLSPEVAYPGVPSVIAEARRQRLTDAEIHERIRTYEDEARATGYTSEEIAQHLGQVSSILWYVAVVKTQSVDVLTFSAPSLLVWLLWDLVRSRRKAVWRPLTGRAFREAARLLTVARRGTAAVLLLFGVGLAAYGALSFEHDLTGTVGHPIILVMYPVWAKVAVVAGVVMAVAGVFIFAATRSRRGNHTAGGLTV